MMNLVRVFQPSRRKQIGEGDASTGTRGSRQTRQPAHTPKPRASEEQQRNPRRGRPTLDRSNATKNLVYHAGAADPDESVLGGEIRGRDRWRLTRSLDVPTAESPLVYFASQTSFRISGEVEGEFSTLCHGLGLSGPDDFAITPDDWAAAGGIPSSNVLLGSDAPEAGCDNNNVGSMDKGAAEGQESLKALRVQERRPSREEDGHDAMPDRSLPEVPVPRCVLEPVSRPHFSKNAVSRGNGGGIKGVRPPLLVPPPPISLPVLCEVRSTWDLFESLAPDGGHRVSDAAYQRRDSFSESEEDKETAEDDDRDLLGENSDLEDDKVLRMGVTSTDLTASCSFWTSNDDDSSSTTTEGNIISPNVKLRRDIGSWKKGQLLGSGSFGTVYEALSDNGFFFAVKEVSLLDGGANAQQCIHQLEQEIALLSQFEHENIVQYLGTAKEEAKFCIFLELVTQGSLASLYHKYQLEDSQVSAYTRQILSGLRYLHDRNVVHRDIKCANILVHANGSVKLTDFGLAKEITKFSGLKSCKGSVYWMAPEVVIPKRSYGPSADMWSLGCTVLEMLTQQHPFPDLEWTQAIWNIGQGRRPPIPDSLSRDARDFIQQCTQVDPDSRPSASKLLDHPFVKRPLPTSGSEASAHISDRATWLQM